LVVGKEVCKLRCAYEAPSARRRSTADCTALAQFSLIRSSSSSAIRDSGRAVEAILDRHQSRRRLVQALDRLDTVEFCHDRVPIAAIL
jgi:hypothetical protein